MTILKIEKDISLEVPNSHKMEADTTASGNIDDHVKSDNIDTGTVPKQENENGQVEENEDEDNKGVVSVLF